MNSSPLADSVIVGETAALMRLLGDPTRVRLLGLLQDGERHVTALCGELDLAQPTVSHHLALLRKSGLIQSRRDGKQIFYSLNAEHIASAMDGQGLHLTYGRVRMHLGCSVPSHHSPAPTPSLC